MRRIGTQYHDYIYVVTRVVTGLRMNKFMKFKGTHHERCRGNRKYITVLSNKQNFFQNQFVFI